MDLIPAIKFARDFDSDALKHFVKYLNAAGFPHRLSEQNDQLVLWVYREEHAPIARELFERYVNGELPELPPEPVRTGGGWKVLLSLPVTLIVMLACLAGFAAFEFGYWPLVGWLSFQGLEVVPGGVQLIGSHLAVQQILHGEVWRLLTPAFLHFSWFHIGFNLALFWFMAQQLERVEGSWRLLSLIAFLAVLSNVLQFYLQPATLFGGLSGVVFGLLAFCWQSRRLNPEYGVLLPPGLMIFSVVMMLIGFTGITDLFGVGIANWAHLGGFVAGLIMAPVLRRKAVDIPQ